MLGIFYDYYYYFYYSKNYYQCVFILAFIGDQALFFVTQQNLVLPCNYSL